jgi:hypothetical protein
LKALSFRSLLTSNWAVRKQRHDNSFS